MTSQHPCIFPWPWPNQPRTVCTPLVNTQTFWFHIVSARFLQNPQRHVRSLLNNPNTIFICLLPTHPKTVCTQGNSTYLRISYSFYMPLTEPPRGCMNATEQSKYHLAIFRCPWPTHPKTFCTPLDNPHILCPHTISIRLWTTRPNTILIEDFPLCFNSKSKPKCLKN